MSDNLRAWSLFANKNSGLYHLRKHKGSSTPSTRDYKLSLMSKGQARFDEKELQSERERKQF